MLISIDIFIKYVEIEREREREKERERERKREGARDIFLLIHLIKS